jgi:hypothetical protein
MRASIQRLLGFAPAAVYLTHYSRVTQVAGCGADLLRHLDVLVSLAEAEAGAGEQRHQRIKQAMADYLFSQLRAHGCRLSDSVLREIWETDLELNTQGLGVWLDSRAA